MDWKNEFKSLFWIVSIFLLCYYLPVENERFNNALKEALLLTKWYANEHVLLCLLPAFFIAGAISVFIDQQFVIQYLGPKSNKFVAFTVASISGVILAVCSCTILPLFAGIYKMGAGLGPAITFLYSGPAISVLAIVLTMRILGLKLGIARAIGAILFSIIIGLIMHLIYKNEVISKPQINNHNFENLSLKRSLFQLIIFFSSMIGILVFANFSKPDVSSGIWYTIYHFKWQITTFFALLLAYTLVFCFNLNGKLVSLGIVATLVAWYLFSNQPVIPFVVATISLSIITSFDKNECGEWFKASWDFAKQILPLLLIGVFISGFLLGRPNHEGLIPTSFISKFLGSDSILANFFASIIGAFMYFATLTEVPIVQGLVGSGMKQGPALALLLSGPALSLPSMLVIKSVIGTSKTIIFTILVIILSTISGILFGILN